MKHITMMYILLVSLSTSIIYTKQSYEVSPNDFQELLQTSKTTEKQAPISDVINTTPTENDELADWNSHLNRVKNNPSQWDDLNNAPKSSWQSDAIILATELVTTKKELADELKNSFFAAISSKSNPMSPEAFAMISSFNNTIDELVKKQEEQIALQKETEEKAKKEKEEEINKQSQEAKVAEKMVIAPQVENKPELMPSTPETSTPAPEIPSTMPEFSPTMPVETFASPAETVENNDTTTAPEIETESLLKEWRTALSNITKNPQNMDPHSIQETKNAMNDALELSQKLIQKRIKSEAQISAEFNLAVSKVAHKLDFSPSNKPSPQKDLPSPVAKMPTTQDLAMQREIQALRQQQEAMEMQGRQQTAQAAQNAEHMKQLEANMELVTRQRREFEMVQAEQSAKKIEEAIKASEQERKKRAEAQKFATMRNIAATIVAQKTNVDQGMLTKALSAAKNWWAGENISHKQSPDELKTSLNNLLKTILSTRTDPTENSSITQQWKSMIENLWILFDPENSTFKDQETGEFDTSKWKEKIKTTLIILVVIHKALSIQDACEIVTSVLAMQTVINKEGQTKILHDLKTTLEEREKDEIQKKLKADAEKKEKKAQKDEIKKQREVEMGRVKTEEERLQQLNEIKKHRHTEFLRLYGELEKLIFDLPHNKTATNGDNAQTTQNAIEIAQTLFSLADISPSDIEDIKETFKQSFTNALLEQHSGNTNEPNIHLNMEQFNRALNQIVEDLRARRGGGGV